MQAADTIGQDSVAFASHTLETSGVDDSQLTAINLDEARALQKPRSHSDTRSPRSE